MSLYDSIKEDEKKLREAEANSPDDGIDPAVKAKAEAPIDDLTADDDNADGMADENAAENDKPEDKTVDEGDKPEAVAKAEDDKLTNSEAGQWRIERKQRKGLQERLDALMAKQDKPIAATPTPAASEGAPAEPLSPVEQRLAALENTAQRETLYKQAVTEFTTIETEFARNTPDYNQAANHMISKMAEGVRYVNPNATDAQISSFLQQQVLTFAGQAAKQGLNPAESLYLLAHEKYGYTGQPAAQPKVDVDATRKRLDTVNKNRQRSATPLTSGGTTGSAKTTIEEAARMDLGDFSKLSEREIDRMISELQ